jgi:hypothetical protein
MKLQFLACLLLATFILNSTAFTISEAVNMAAQGFKALSNKFG